uniref:Uncharacterized protein n=1 Tax=Oryza meridionalis TaxID=40149 RepID=A0A0E0FEB7_9ORYZ
MAAAPLSAADIPMDGAPHGAAKRFRFNYGTVIANSLLSLSNLTEELTLYVPTVPEPFPRGRFGWCHSFSSTCSRLSVEPRQRHF